MLLPFRANQSPERDSREVKNKGSHASVGHMLIISATLEVKTGRLQVQVSLDNLATPPNSKGKKKNERFGTICHIRNIETNSR